jgi:hypothetical protein
VACEIAGAEFDVEASTQPKMLRIRSPAPLEAADLAAHAPDFDRLSLANRPDVTPRKSQAGRCGGRCPSRRLAQNARRSLLYLWCSRTTRKPASASHAERRDPVGFANSGGLVFVDQSAEEVVAAEIGRQVDRCRVAAVWREEVERAVRPVFVVMPTIDAKDVLEMAAPDDQFHSL